MYEDTDPETPVSGEDRVIDCPSMGVVRWEISQSMWDYLGTLPEEDRQRILDIMTDKLHELCHGICGYVVRFVESKNADAGHEANPGDTFPESWLHE